LVDKINIVVAGHSHFGAPWMVGSHQLALAWARAGHRVLHLSPPITPWHAVRVADPLVRGRYRSAIGGVQRVEAGLMNWVPLGLLPWVWGAHLYRYLGTSLPSCTVGLVSALRRAGFQAPDLLVVDHPQFYNLDLVLSPGRVLYRGSELFAEIHNRRIVNDIERALITRVDCVIATSEPVAQRLRDHGRAIVTLFENGVEFAHMSHPVPPPAEYSRLKACRAVYAGAIDNRFGVALLLELARARPDVEFVLIGSGTAVAEIAASRLANVHLLGTRPYADLPAYLQHASVGLLPFNAHPANAGRSPMKFYEYAAAGLPIAASLTPEFARRREAFVRFFDPQDPALALDEVLTQRPIPEPARIASRDWSLIAQTILDHAVSSHGAKPSAS
jgi:glycosyltransferase involved in cell wall biosynthesis